MKACCSARTKPPSSNLKRKLLEECDLYCIISLPGGVFSSAGAGVKTNLVFFTKGRPTKKIWYYDLSDLKIGKKTPITQAHFDDFFAQIPKRADSPKRWTIDFAGRLQAALVAARPHEEKAAELFARAKALDEDLREKRKASYRGGDGSSRQAKVRKVGASRPHPDRPQICNRDAGSPT